MITRALPITLCPTSTSRRIGFVLRTSPPRLSPRRRPHLPPPKLASFLFVGRASPPAAPPRAEIGFVLRTGSRPGCCSCLCAFAPLFLPPADWSSRRIMAVLGRQRLCSL